jgi:hypothetical protein
MASEYLKPKSTAFSNNEMQVAAPSVNSQADNALENASLAHAFAESLLNELRQVVNEQCPPSACRYGIDGKLADAAEHSSATLSVLQEIRAYLLG